jgi:NAD(P)-dependent dehydrogenase (short-subunit alcohol dehydrogenase family)
MASLRLASRVAVVTGASSGLGRAIALEMALNGARVVCADLKPRGHDADVNEKPTHELIVETGQQSIFVATDVADASSVKMLIQATVDKFGRLDM